MGDTDFPTVMANGPSGFLQTYVRGMREHEQAGTDIPDFRVQQEYAQEGGGPLIEGTQISADPSFDLMGPDIDSPEVDNWIRNSRPQPRLNMDRLNENIRRVRSSLPRRV
jgi:hypothetical protein